MVNLSVHQFNRTFVDFLDNTNEQDDLAEKRETYNTITDANISTRHGRMETLQRKCLCFAILVE